MQLKDFLKTQYIFIATPCYGGVVSCSYTTSLSELISMCNDIGLRYKPFFIANESIVVRARNRLVDEFMRSDATHIVFIDSDMGFSASDIISLITPNVDIVCIPYPKKILRLERLAAAVAINEQQHFLSLLMDSKEEDLKDKNKFIEKMKQELCKETERYSSLSIQELENLTSEFTLTLSENKRISDIDFTKLQEVEAAGTGLMCISRNAFSKFMECYPERLYIQSQGEETGKREVFSFFRCGLADYKGERNWVSEDYLFCRDAKAAGMKIYITPSATSTHYGPHLFRGNLQAVSDLDKKFES